MEVYNHDLVILGTGLAGLRAALEAAQQSKGELDIALVSKLQLMRAHSVAAEGGTAAVMRQDEGDSYELHAWDTVKGSDFLADQDVVDREVQHRVVGRQDGPAGIPEHHAHPFAHERVPQNLRAGHCLFLSHITLSRNCQPVTAPCEADETSRAYFASTPR